MNSKSPEVWLFENPSLPRDLDSGPPLAAPPALAAPLAVPPAPEEHGSSERPLGELGELGFIDAQFFAPGQAGEELSCPHPAPQPWSPFSSALLSHPHPGLPHPAPLSY